MENWIGDFFTKLAIAHFYYIVKCENLWGGGIFENFEINYGREIINHDIITSNADHSPREFHTFFFAKGIESLPQTLIF